MRITSYSFGSITVDGVTYRKDVIILPGGVFSPWWRKDGHSLVPEDLKAALDAGPAMIVIGTGALGVMRVPKDTVKFLEEKGIEVIIAKTSKAVDIFNSAPQEKIPVAAFHLTC